MHYVVLRPSEETNKTIHDVGICADSKEQDGDGIGTAGSNPDNKNGDISTGTS